MRPILYYINHPVDIFRAISSKLSFLVPDKFFVEVIFRNRMGYWPNLKNPKTFSEKLQWLKLYNHRPEYTTMVDKYAVKQYVANMIGEEYIIPTLGAWDNPEDIDFDSLPRQFVLKCTHDSGTVIVVKDKDTLNRRDTIKKIKKWLKRNYFLQNREWPYKNVPRRIIAEKYIEPSTDANDLPDYKFFCFNGEPKYCQVISGRESKMCIDFFDKDWTHQPFHEPYIYPFAEIEPKKPANYDKMWKAASILAEGKPFSRIDFYDVNGKVYFGEITFFPTSGWGGFSPKEWDDYFGDLIMLPHHK